jgi:cytoskeletal protein RodZ
MDEFPLGNLLREKRTSLGLSIEQVAGDTKIPRQYLEALEGEQFNIIPGEGYVKGFLRTYGNYLELDPDPIIEMYSTRYGNGMGPRTLFAGSRAGASKDTIARLRWRLLPTTAKEGRENLIIWLLICATLVAVWILYHYLLTRNADVNVATDTAALVDATRCVARQTMTFLTRAAQALIP